MRVDYFELDECIVENIKALESINSPACFSRIYYLCRPKFDLNSSLHKQLSAHVNGGLYRAVDRRLQNLRKQGLIYFHRTKKWRTKTETQPIGEGK